MDELNKTQNTASNKGKVLFVITKSNFGGAQRYVYELAVRSKEKGFSVAVALGGNGILKTKLEQSNIDVFQLEDAQRDIDITKEFKVLWKLLKIMRNFRPNIVHLNSPKIGGLGALAARLSGVKRIIYTNHGWPFKEVRPEWQLIFIRILSWVTVFLGKKTIVLSQTERDFVKNWPLIQNKLVIVPNGLSPFNLMTKQEALTALIGREKTDQILIEQWTVIGTISELHKNKGINFALEGIKLYTEHVEAKAQAKSRLLYIVIGEGEQRQSLEQTIKEKGLGDHVVLVGSVDNARQYLSAFDIFLLSSIKEGLPYAILEAGFARVPVISTSVGGVPEVIENLKTGLLIPPARPTEIKNALIYIEEHQDIKEELTLNLNRKVNEVYNFEKIASQIEELYSA